MCTPCLYETKMKFTGTARLTMCSKVKSEPVVDPGPRDGGEGRLMFKVVLADVSEATTEAGVLKYP
jgi:hypothetical protein